MAEKKGICKNYVNCPLADEEKVQIVDDINFVCTHCHQPLTPVDGDKEKKPMDPNKKRLLLLIIAVLAVLAALGVGGYFLLKGQKAKKAEARAAFVADSIRQAQEQRIADSLRVIAEQKEAEEAARLQAEQEEAAAKLAEEQRIADSIRKADSLAALKKQKPEQPTKPAQPSQPSSGSSNWNGVASYNGPMQGGQPNGVGGKLTFKSGYQLDLKDGNGTKLQINAGETIENTKFENGKLRQGELHRNDGTRKWFSI